MIVISMCQSVNDGHELWASSTEIITSDYCYNQSSGRQKIKQIFSCNHEEEESPLDLQLGVVTVLLGLVDEWLKAHLMVPVDMLLVVFYGRGKHRN